MRTESHELSMADTQEPQVEYDNDDGGQEKKGRGDCCKKFLKFLFSHIGLCGMVVAYSVAGGFIFQHLEQTNEKQECVKKMDKYNPMENETTFKLWEIAQAFVPESNDDTEIEPKALGEIESILKKFRTDVLELDYDGKNCTIMGDEGGPGFQWSFPGALLFSVTVITTIGKSYHHQQQHQTQQ